MEGAHSSVGKPAQADVAAKCLIDRLTGKTHDGGKHRMTSTAERDKIFQFIIILKYTKPPIWRKIEVPGSYSFRQFHKSIQAAMGWQSADFDYHLHKFELGNCTRAIGCNLFGGGLTDDEKDLDEKECFVYQYFSKENPLGTTRANYEYDFGDCWEHSILLEQVTDPKPGTKYPLCIKGKGACPPEDVGGVYGFYALLDLLRNPRDADYEERKQWAKDQGFDVDGNPADFDPAKVTFPNMDNEDSDSD